MKNIKNWAKKEFKRFCQEESAQGMTEYILLAVVVIGALIAFKQPIQDALSGKTSDVTSEIGNFGF